jgi:hypothetical protein
MTVSCTTHNLSNAQGLWLAVLALTYERSEEWILGARKEEKPWQSISELAVQIWRYDADLSMSDRFLTERGSEVS